MKLKYLSVLFLLGWMFPGASHCAHFTKVLEADTACANALGWTGGLFHQGDPYPHFVACADATDYQSYSAYVQNAIPICSPQTPKNTLCRTGDTIGCGKIAAFVMCVFTEYSADADARDRCYNQGPLYDYRFVSQWFTVDDAKHSVVKQVEDMWFDSAVGDVCGETGEKAVRVYSSGYSETYGCEGGYYQTGGSDANMTCDLCPDDEGIPATSEEGNTSINGCYIASGTYQAPLGKIKYPEQCSYN